MDKNSIIKALLSKTAHGSFVNAMGGYAWAPSNIALGKYWGKRDLELNLPMTGSLSVTLGNKGAFTHIKQEGNADHYVVNGVTLAPSSNFAQRLQRFLQLFRPHPQAFYTVVSETTVPIGAGLASSACGFAALVQALNKLYDWRLSKTELAILARLGSGSACRSIFEGFVEWQRGERPDGMDSYPLPLIEQWPELRIGALILARQEKYLGSTAAMQHTVTSAPNYQAWPAQVAHDLAQLKLALQRHDFTLLGTTAETNSQAMHALMQTAQPPINYSLPATLQAMQTVWRLRKGGVPVFFTQDAGPNLQLLFPAQAETPVVESFPELEVVAPFLRRREEEVVLVNEADGPLGTEAKLTAHLRGSLHRAFSVFLLRQRAGKLETLLQQRSALKYHSANLWSNSCCGHPRPGEPVLEAAERRLFEELGFSTKLQRVGQFHYLARLAESGLIEHELDHVLVGFTQHNDFQVNPAEVQAYRWLDLDTLKKELLAHPNRYSVWLSQALAVLRSNYSALENLELL